MNVRASLPLDDIIGRSEEVAAVDELLGRVRLVTITGLGGIGKSRVAGEVAERRAMAGDEVAFVDLTTVTRPDLVADRVAQALGIAESAGATPVEAVSQFLAERSSLLILDSFEHVLGAASQVREFLAVAPRLSVLVTSRLALRIAGEREFPLGPLSLPADPGWTAVSASPAGRLFIREAERIGTTVGPDDAAGIDRVCARLGGIPLGISLAAARTRLFSPTVLADRLDQHLPSLPRGATAQDPLTTILDWTVDLLDEPEQARFYALGVLTGSFGLSTVTVLWETDDPLELMDTLIRLGLVRRVDGAERFGLLPPVREFARQRLHDRGDEPGAMGRLAGWAIDLATTQGPAMRGRDQSAAVGVVQAEMTNLRSVVDWLTALDPPAAAEIVVALDAYWFRIAIREGLEIASALLGRPRVDEVTSARLLYIIAATERPLIGPERAAEHATMMLDIAMRLDDRWLEMRARSQLGVAVGAAEAMDQLLLAAGLAHRLGEPIDELYALSNLGVVQLNAGDLETAGTTLRAALETSRSIGDPLAVAMNLANLAEVLLLTGRIAEIDALTDEASAILAGLPSGLGIGYVTCIRAATAARSNDRAAASALLGHAARLVESRGGWYEKAMLLEYAALIRSVEGRPREAALLLGAVDLLRVDAGESPDAIRSVVGRAVAAEIEHDLGERTPHAIAAGRAVDPAFLVAGLATPVAPVPAVSGRHGRLSPREIEVLRLVADGATDGDIAAALFISPKTASVHVSNLRDKLGSSSRVELALEGRRLLSATGPDG